MRDDRAINPRHFSSAAPIRPLSGLVTTTNDATYASYLHWSIEIACCGIQDLIRRDKSMFARIIRQLRETQSPLVHVLRHFIDNSSSTSFIESYLQSYLQIRCVPRMYRKLYR